MSVKHSQKLEKSKAGKAQGNENRAAQRKQILISSKSSFYSKIHPCHLVMSCTTYSW